MPLSTIYVFVNVHSNFMCVWNTNREVHSLHIYIYSSGCLKKEQWMEVGIQKVLSFYIPLQRLEFHELLFFAKLVLKSLSSNVESQLKIRHELYIQIQGSAFLQQNVSIQSTSPPPSLPTTFFHSFHASKHLRGELFIFLFSWVHDHPLIHA